MKLIFLFCVLTSLMAQHADQPETVMVMLHAKPGAEADLTGVIARHWTTARKMKLVHETPHLTLRGTEDGGKTWFVEVFTWRNAGIPDAAPAEIRKIRAEMNRLVEARGGHAGLEFVPMSILDH
jgi:hypothetical protein